MKRISAILLALIISVSLCACGGAAEPAPTAEPTSTAEPTPTPTPMPEPTPEPTPAPEFSYTPPEGWTADEESPNMFYAPDYPEDGSNINYTIEERDEAFDRYDEEILSRALSQTLSESLETEIEIDVVSFDRTETDGMPALRIEYSFTYMNLPMTQVVYSVNGKQCYSFTLTQVGDNEWVEAFEESLKSVVFPE